MKKLNEIKIMFVFVVLVLNVKASDENEIVKSLKPKETLVIENVNGNCEFRVGKVDEIKLYISYTIPEKYFSIGIKEKFNSIIVEQNSHKVDSISRISEEPICYKGSSKWIVFVPENTNIKMKTSSGNVTIEDVKGSFEIDCSSGNITASGISIEGDSEFITSSGNVNIELNNSPVSDITVKSSTGNAVLDYNGNKLLGSFMMVARKDNGNIRCPFKFSNEETFEYYKNIADAARAGERHVYGNNLGKQFMKKSFIKGDLMPYVLIQTSIGKAVLKY